MRILKWSFIGCFLANLVGHSVALTPDDSKFQLSVEMRDGSRVIGQVQEDGVGFHSATLGDTKLSWSHIRTIDFSADTDSEHLTGTNGDEFTVQLSDESLHLNTSFGKTDLPVKSIRNIKVSSLPKPNSFDVLATGKDAQPRLSIELQDGSHLLGTPSDEAIDFHSSPMGNMKLPWIKVRSITSTGSDKDHVQLTTSTGDFYEVKFTQSVIKIETNFGQKELPIDSIQNIQVLAAVQVAEGLVGWWKLDDGNGTVAHDSSANPHDGTLMNGPLWIQGSIRTPAALEFNGADQWVSLGNVLEEGYKEVSIACWIKHSGRTQNQIIAMRSLWDNPSGLGLYLGNNTSVAFGHFTCSVSSKSDVQDDQWHHVVGTLNSNGTTHVYSLYVDGKLDNTFNGEMGLTPSTSGWGLGARFNDGTVRYDGVQRFDGFYNYRGLIADLRIYDRALTASEVQAIYSSQNPEHFTSTRFPPPKSPLPTPEE